MVVAMTPDEGVWESPWPRPGPYLLSPAIPATPEHGCIALGQAVYDSEAQPTLLLVSPDERDLNFEVSPAASGARPRMGPLRPGARALSRRTRLRRTVAGAMILSALVLLALPVSALGGRSPLGGGSATTTRGEFTYVVQPGDSVGSIAARFEGGGEPGTLIRAITAELGSDVVVPGERIRLP